MKTVCDTDVLNHLLFACIKTATSSILVDMFNDWYFLNTGILKIIGQKLYKQYFRYLSVVNAVGEK